MGGNNTSLILLLPVYKTSAYVGLFDNQYRLSGLQIRNINYLYSECNDGKKLKIKNHKSIDKKFFKINIR